MPVFRYFLILTDCGCEPLQSLLHLFSIRSGDSGRNFIRGFGSQQLDLRHTCYQSLVWLLIEILLSILAAGIDVSH